MVKSFIQHSYFEKKPKKQMGKFQSNPSIEWLHPKFAHAHPLAWAKNKFTHKPITISIQPTFDPHTLIPAQKGFPQCLCRTEPTNYLASQIDVFLLFFTIDCIRIEMSAATFQRRQKREESTQRVCLTNFFLMGWIAVCTC